MNKTDLIKGIARELYDSEEAYGEINAVATENEYEDVAERIVNKFFIHIVSNCAKVEDKPTPLNWLLRDKLGIEKGTTYIEPKLTVRQCASWISEYVKKHCC